MDEDPVEVTAASAGTGASIPLAIDTQVNQEEGKGEHRPIRSFVLRQGRMSAAQQRACDERYSCHGVAGDAPLDFRGLFGNASPVVLEIGSGMGETTAAIAAAHPDVNFLAVEMHWPGVGALLRRIDSQNLLNLRVLRRDAVDVVERMVVPASLAGIHVYFPDPWPKKRHHKRRLLKSAFVHALALKLVPGGYLHVATDWANYADEILATLTAESLLANTTAAFAPRPAWRPLTKFEQRGIDRGHAVFDIVFTAAPAPAMR